MFLSALVRLQIKHFDLLRRYNSLIKLVDIDFWGDEL